MTEPSLTVVVVCHNQCEQLRQTLPLLLAQDYPENYEVVAVDMLSDDDTALYLSAMERQHSRLVLRSVPPTTRGIGLRQLAITMGIRTASSDRVILTQADCCPVSQDWLRLMAEAFTPDVTVLLGYTQHQETFSKEIRRYRTFRFRTQWKKRLQGIRTTPLLLEATNLGYRKQDFLRHRGFATDQKVERIHYCLAEPAIVKIIHT